VIALSVRKNFATIRVIVKNVQKMKPTVLDTITYMASTGFTNEFIIVGSSLHELMQKIISDLIQNPWMFDKDKIEFDAPETYYSNDFYTEVWFKSIRPLAEQYIRLKFPYAWFLKVYSTKKFEA
jgi:hypothetical protein